MKALNIKELKVKNTFNKGKVDSTYIITYDDMTYQILDIEDLTESDKHRISEFMKKADVDVTIRRYPKSNITKTVGMWRIYI